jgi:hypothetical protein
VRRAASSLMFGVGLLMVLVTSGGSSARRQGSAARAASPDLAPGANPAGDAEGARSTSVLSGWWTAAALASVVVVAAASRLRYMMSWDGTYGSGDSHLNLVRAFHIMNWNLAPNPELAVTSRLFDQPPLIPVALAGVARVTGVPLQSAPLLLVPLLTIGAIVVLFRALIPRFGLIVATGASIVVATIPRVSFDSTEPEKAPVVVSLVIFALAALYRAERDRIFLPIAGALLAVAMLAHTTAYFFLPIFALSWAVMHRGKLRSALGLHAGLALALPIAAIGAYFALSYAFGQAPPSTTTAEAGSSAVPEFVRTYWDTTLQLIRGGFAESAGGTFVHAIRAQLTSPLFFLAIGGVALATYETARGRTAALPFLLWAVGITLIFAVQYEASSHRSRYPTYVTPAYAVWAIYFAAWSSERLAARWTPGLRQASLLAVVIVTAYAMWSFAGAQMPGSRNLLVPNVHAANYVTSERLLDGGGSLLYMEWPSITMNILRERPDYEDQLIGFGFGSRPLEEFTPQFMRENNVTHYIHARTGNDAWRSADVTYHQLQTHFLLEELATFRSSGFTTIYALHPRAELSEGELAAVYEYLSAERGGSTLLANPDLCATAVDSLPGWEKNGTARLLPAGDCGVMVAGDQQWSGVRQWIFPQRTVGALSAVVMVEPVGINPARSLVVALYRETGDERRLISDVKVDLDPVASLVLFEAVLPDAPGRYQFVVASGAGDTGQYVLHGIAMEAATATDLLVAAGDAGY